MPDPVDKLPLNLNIASLNQCIIMTACMSRGNSKDSRKVHDPQSRWTLASLSGKMSDERKEQLAYTKGERGATRQNIHGRIIRAIL